jgi:hypothetical protein
VIWRQWVASQDFVEAGPAAQFSRAFKMRFGVSPKDYRDQAAKAARSGLYDRR